MKKKIISLILVFCFVFGLASSFGIDVFAATATGTCGTGVSWSFYEGSHHLTITGTGEMTGSAGYSAYADKIYTVRVYDGVTGICDNAFSACAELTEAVLPESLTSIGAYAFKGCSKLTAVNIPASVTAVGAYTFSGCECLASITLPTGITSIGAYAFQKCAALPEIVIPAGVTSIGTGAFSDCRSITSVSIPSGVTSIGRSIINGCDALKTVSVESGNTVYYSDSECIIEKSTKKLIAGCQSSTIPGNIVTIGEYAFASCVNLAAVTIPSSVTAIGKCAFSGCGGLTEISIPASVTLADQQIFERCSGLKRASVGNGLASVPSYMFYECDGLEEISLGKAVSSIGDYAFYGCDSLNKITADSLNEAYYVKDNCLITKYTYRLDLGCKASIIPEEVCSIGSYAFIAQNELTSITLPENVITIGNYAFKECGGLETVVLNEGLKKIGTDAFSYCGSLTALNIPSTAVNVAFPFENCNALESLTVASGNTAYYCTDNCIISKSSEALLMGCKNSTVPYGVTAIGEGAFYGCTGLTSVSVPATATTIYNYAFANCTGLSDLKIAYGVNGINYCAFSGCTGLTQVAVPSTVQYISDFAFFGCNGIEDLSLPFTGYSASSTTKNFLGYIFGATAYTENGSFVPKSLKKVTLVKSTKVAANAFYGCDGITEIVIPDTVTGIGKGAFTGCNGLTAITLPFVGESAALTGNTFFGYIFGAASYSANNSYVPKTLSSVTITKATGIAAYAFYNCRYITRINLPKTLTSIGAKAFYLCKALTDIHIYESVTSIGSSAFYSCANLTLLCKKGSVAEEYAVSNSINYSSYSFICEVEGHTPGAVPTCVDAQVCTVCGTVLQEATGEHIYELTESREATETEDGYTIEQCTVCGEQKYTVIKKTSHEEGGAVTPTGVLGDVSGDGTVDEEDLRILTCYLAGWKYYGAEVSVSDINRDGKVTLKDRMILARYLQGWDGYDEYFK